MSVSIKRDWAVRIGSCNSCVRHDQESVVEFLIGDPENLSTSVRLCDDCLKELKEALRELEQCEDLIRGDNHDKR